MSDIKTPLGSGPVLLSAEPIRIDGEKPVEGEATVRLDLLPRPDIVIDAELHDGGLWSGARFLRAQEVIMEFPRRRISVKIHITQVTFGAYSTLRGVIDGSFSIPATRAPSRIEFQLLNFPHMLSQHQNEGKGYVIYGASFGAGEWLIEIDPVDNITEILRTVGSSGGYVLTHQAKLTHTSGESFSSEAAGEVLEVLHYYFSFARGFWSGPLLPTGYDAENNRVWAKWSAPSSTSWQGVPSWFDSHHSNLLVEVFPGFFERWQRPNWTEALQRAIYWYLGSNIGSAGLEGSILLSQTALELLAWSLLVEERGTLSKDGFKRLPAADQIRLLLSMIGVPLAIPAAFQDLQDVAAKFNWIDGPDVFVGLRNSIVHPGDRGRVSKASVDARYQAWELGQWYVELTILWLSGHNGKYANRLVPSRWVGQVEYVPWASQAGTSEA